MDPQFRVEILTTATICRFVVSGDIDLACADDLASYGLDALGDPAISALEVDLGQVSFMDSSGLGALFRIHTAARDLAKPMTLHDVPNRITQILRISGLDLLMPIQ